MGVGVAVDVRVGVVVGVVVGEGFGVGDLLCLGAGLETVVVGVAEAGTGDSLPTFCWYCGLAA